MPEQIKVAVIGGGCGALTAAFELTRPEHCGRYAVTVYQEGWRLGGKGASGRGPAGRVEEHGLHVWLGFYANAFGLLRDCYAELAAAGNSPYGHWQDAFIAEPDIGLFAPGERGDWQKWAARFPPRPGLPGDPAPPGERPSLAGYLDQALALLRTLVLDVEVSRHGAAGPAQPPLPRLWPLDPAVLHDPELLLGLIRRLIGRNVFSGAVIVAEALGLMRNLIGTLPAALDSRLLRVAEVVAGGLRQWLEDNLLADDGHRQLWIALDLLLAVITGALRFGLLTDPRGLDAIDDYDCTDWLRLNGASERALRSPFVEGMYDLFMAFEHGDPNRPRVAAGQALRATLRMFFGYRGSIYYRLRHGMGDVVFAPIYEVLRRRGVRFEFFHRLTNVALPPGGEIRAGDRTHVAALDFDVQALVREGREYEPLVEVKGRPCWPAAPDLTQVVDGETMAAEGRDFESHWDRRRAGRKRLEVGRDFDLIVLGVSLGGIPHVCREILARDARWRSMATEVKTVATQAFQIWLEEDLEQLGWQGPPYIVSAFPKPFDTWCDMAHVVPEEGWARPPATAVYFCGVLEDPATEPEEGDAGYPGRRAEEVRRSALEFLAETARPLWPGAYGPGGGFRWDILADAGGTAPPQGPARFASQYWRASVNPSDRYVLSVPGSPQHRVSPLDMTYDNMTIAGDWTDCGLNLGCAEAAAISGRLAAHALCGMPALEDIPGYDHP